VLAASYGSNEKENTQGGKRIQVDWAVNIGEDVVDIKIAKYGQNLSSSQYGIVVLGKKWIRLC
jgi:predicted secreted hydrolase